MSIMSIFFESNKKSLSHSEVRKAFYIFQLIIMNCQYTYTLSLPTVLLQSNNNKAVK